MLLLIRSTIFKLKIGPYKPNQPISVEQCALIPLDLRVNSYARFCKLTISVICPLNFHCTTNKERDFC